MNLLKAIRDGLKKGWGHFKENLGLAVACFVSGVIIGLVIIFAEIFAEIAPSFSHRYQLAATLSIIATLLGVAIYTLIENFLTKKRPTALRVGIEIFFVFKSIVGGSGLVLIIKEYLPRFIKF